MEDKYRIVREGGLFYPEYFYKFLFISYWKRFKEGFILLNGPFTTYDELDVYFSSKDMAKDYINTYKNKQIKKVVWEKGL